MNNKTCFKCHKSKPLSAFYTHPRMRDGHLGKCKTCTKADTKKRTEILMGNKEWVESERARGREKYFRLGYKNKSKNSVHTLESNRAYRLKYPEKYVASIEAQHIDSGGLFKHHWSYCKEHRRDVIFLSLSDHAKVHRYMIYDQERMMYRKTTGELIDTREAAVAFYESIKTMP